ncbi:MAG: nucleotide exchange factor GrpE [Alphaproteobacteria bacterium]|nr:nucleotide exchange factor GrpE [Alphaproteobacteria bacterium]
MQESNVHAARISQLEEELAKTKDLMMRTVAEAENGRKRALKDREDAGKFAISGFARDLLSVADNLRRALESIPDGHAADEQTSALLNGVEATEKELLRAFEKHGVQKIEPINKIFDPNYHEVMFETPVLDKPNGAIIQVIEPGYILNGRIIRPAKVGVAKNESISGTDPGQTTNIEV